MSLIEHDKWQYHEARTPKASMRLTALNDRQKAILAAMVYGSDTKKAGGRPLSANDAAAYFRVRRGYVRDLLQQPVVKAELASLIAAKRLGLVPKAIDVLDRAMDSRNEGTAIKASVALLGETAKSPAVMVNVNNQTAFIAGTIKPGYVLKLPPDIETSVNPTD